HGQAAWHAAPGCLEVQGREVVQQHCRFALQRAAALQGIAHGWPAGLQWRQDALAQVVAVVPGIGIAGILDPAQALLLRPGMQRFARPGQQGAQQPPLPQWPLSRNTREATWPAAAPEEQEDGLALVVAADRKS